MKKILLWVARAVAIVLILLFGLSLYISIMISRVEQAVAGDEAAGMAERYQQKLKGEK